MPYKLTDEAWVEKETDRARGVLLHKMVRGQAYTVAEVLTLLADYGLIYSNPEYAPIGLALIAEEIIESV